MSTQYTHTHTRFFLLFQTYASTGSTIAKRVSSTHW